MITDKPYTLERKLFGYTVSRDAAKLGEQSVHVAPRMLGRHIGDLIVAHSDPDGSAFNERHISLLYGGIQDTYAFYDSVLTDRINKQKREAVANHPVTQANLLRAAMHNYISVEIRLGRSPYTDSAYALSENDSYIRNTRSNTNLPGEGCPFAGNNRLEQVDPLFKAFGRWATQLVFSHHDALAQNRDPIS